MNFTIIILSMLFCILIWLCIKIITLLERQTQQNQSIEITRQNLESQFKNLSSQISNNQERASGLQQQLITCFERINNHQKTFSDILTDKRSRGAFGEMQLATLVHNLIPNKYAKMQHTLSNGKRADCIILLPEPTKPIVIDAKFPLENYKNMIQHQENEQEKNNFARLFKKDIKHHIDSIAEKYINPPETSNSAMMFIPAEAIFAEIHAIHPDIVEYAHKKKVWLASPSTLMAILTTAASVIKDSLTEKNLDSVRKHLDLLGQDFERFYSRLSDLFKHINLCTQDANKIQISGQKIINNFKQIHELNTEEESV